MAQPVFVLVHGAWQGGWCWKKVVPLLQTAGYQVFTPTLTGLGERAHLIHPDIDLSTHIQDVLAVLEYEDLWNVILVGHSYGGMVITGVADQACERLAHLVYLDAFLPQNGKALQDYAPVPPVREDGWRIPSPSTPEEFGATNEKDINWMVTRLGDQPIKTFTQPLLLSEENIRSVPKTYIQCTRALFFMEAGERAKSQGCRYQVLCSTDHDSMVTRPDELAKMLLELA